MGRVPSPTTSVFISFSFLSGNRTRPSWASASYGDCRLGSQGLCRKALRGSPASWGLRVSTPRPPPPDPARRQAVSLPVRIGLPQGGVTGIIRNQADLSADPFSTTDVGRWPYSGVSSPALSCPPHLVTERNYQPPFLPRSALFFLDRERWTQNLCVHMYSGQLYGCSLR